MLNYYNSSTIYVSQSIGNDAYTGCKPAPDGIGGGPVRSFDRVMDMIITMRVGGIMQPITVRVMGDHYLDAPIEVRAKFPGNFYTGDFPLRNVTIEGYGDSRARIIGGRRLTGFSRDTFNGVPCVSLHIPEVEAGTWKFTDLYVGGKRADLPHYPQKGMLRAVTTERTDAIGYPDGSRWFVAHKEDLEGVEGVENAIVSFFHYWVDEHNPVVAYNKETGRIDMAYRSRFAITANYDLPDTDDNATSKFFYILENMPSYFLNPNEWYLDRAKGMLYYIPEDFDTFENLEVFAPTQKHLIRLEGTPENRVEGIRIRNLDFLCTKGDHICCHPPLWTHHGEYAEEGEILSADRQSVFNADGAVRFAYAANCAVENCNITCVGLHAVEINRGCEGVRVEGCCLTQIGAGGVKIYGHAYGEDERDKTSHCKVRGNTISYIGRRHDAGCGVLLCHSSYNEIFDNEICYTNYTGISVGWEWGYRPTTSFGNHIRRNHIHQIGIGRLSDLAAIYLLGTQNGTVVAENHIHDVKSTQYGHGIYTDEGSCFVTIERNLVYRIHTNCFYQHYGHGNVVRENIFAFGNGSTIAVGRNEAHAGYFLENNVIISGGEPIYHCYYTNFYGGLPLRAINNHIAQADGGEPCLFRNRAENRDVGLAEWQSAYGIDEGSTIGLPEGVVVDAVTRTVRLEKT